MDDTALDGLNKGFSMLTKFQKFFMMFNSCNDDNK